MRKNQRLFQGLSLLIAVAVMLGVTSCGTILYPERRGQSAGKIDVGVAVLDGIGLLVFFVPGVIAFVVDFSTGAIYLPQSSSSQLEINPSNLQDSEVIKVDSKTLTRLEIERLLQEKFRREIDLALPEIRVAKVLPDQPLAWGSITETLTASQLAGFENNSMQCIACYARKHLCSPLGPHKLIKGHMDLKKTFLGLNSFFAGQNHAKNV